MQKWIKLLRPHHWVKNVLVLAPLVFAESLFDLTLLAKSIIAFACFCLLTSGVYIINDIFDREQDRRHPAKKNRPIAAGIISIKSATIIAALLLLLSLFGSFWLEPIFGIMVVAYFGIEIAYTLKLKEVVILETFCIAAGLVLRVVGGAVAIQVEPSNWLLICVGSLALFLGFSKRRSELLQLGGKSTNHRQVLAEYNPYYLDQMMLITIAATIGVYSLYILDAETVARFGKEFALTIPFVFYGVFRYQYLIYHRNTNKDPIVNLLFDRPLLISCLLWVLSVVLIIYL